MRVRLARTDSRSSIQDIQRPEVAPHKLVGLDPRQVAHVRNAFHDSRPAKKLARIVREEKFP
jgi:hypothetical protein